MANKWRRSPRKICNSNFPHEKISLNPYVAISKHVEATHAEDIAEDIGEQFHDGNALDFCYAALPEQPGDMETQEKNWIELEMFLSSEEFDGIMYMALSLLGKMV